MNRQQCIYWRDGDVCACQALAHCRPNCPWWRPCECRCGGYVGALDAGRVRQMVMVEPVPTLMRWRA